MTKTTTARSSTTGKPAPLPGIVRPNGRKAGEVTRERMLDAAEAIFALHGFHGTSMREVAQQSDARLALVAYHFGTKDTLFDKVVERRASVMAHHRMQLLDEARSRAGSGPLALDDLVTGYVYPFVERSTNGGRGWKHYSLLVARASNAPDYAKVIGVHYNAVARQFLAEFCRALPEVDEEKVYHAFSFMVGTMLSLVAEPGRVESLSSGRYKSSDLERVFASMLPFLVAGFSSLADKGQDDALMKSTNARSGAGSNRRPG
ncbi:TetR/AcrR family transcriptional regulator [Variovorax sp. KK3]|uniref:TetR/AcrR family transcriptional regulator n=1 Tax=Variovorax sp. KK3 TaxID=1855728 RepID=UPI0015C3C6C9|nr:TetR/AcrR family transcriptional regulator [Variovorax sp. KK3]